MNCPIYKFENFPNFKKCVLTYGHFNSVHPGHIRYLKKASNYGESLLVAVLPDTENGIKKHISSHREREQRA